MKISELQKILNHYKKEDGDLEIRLTVDTRFGEQYDILDYDAIDTKAVYDEKEFNNLVDNMGLTEQQALDNLEKEGLAKVYLDIYTYIK